MKFLKTVSAAILILLIAQTAQADYIRRQEVAFTHGSNNTVRFLPYSTITVYSAGTTSLVPIWSDAGSTPKSNPLTSDQYGNYFYYTATGIYDEKIEKAGYTTTYNYDISVGTVVENLYGVVSSGTNTLTLTISADYSYDVGVAVSFMSTATNTGPVTININGGGAKSIRKHVLTYLEPGDILANRIHTIIYDGTNFQLQSPADSVLHTKTLEIGDWNMYYSGGGSGASSKQITESTHGIPYSKIVKISCTIIEDQDMDAHKTNLERHTSGWISLSGNGNIALSTAIGGFFDNSYFNATSYNRGYVVILYTD